MVLRRRGRVDKSSALLIDGDIELDDAGFVAGRVCAGLERDDEAGGADPIAGLFKGDIELEGAGTISTGDAVRLTAAGELRATAGAEGTEVVVWAMAGSAA